MYKSFPFSMQQSLKQTKSALIAFTPDLGTSSMIPIAQAGKLFFIFLLKAIRGSHCLPAHPHQEGLLPLDWRGMVSTRPSPLLVRCLPPLDFVRPLYVVCSLLLRQRPDCDRLSANLNRHQEPLFHVTDNLRLVHQDKVVNNKGSMGHESKVQLPVS